jgi:cephalosporin-C deacetylase-like acetyl esterase
MQSRSLFLLLLLAAPALAVAPQPSTSVGDRQRDDYFRTQAQRLADADLAEIRTKADYERLAPKWRKEFLAMMGLDPLPPRGNLHATITGTIDAPSFTIQKLHYQSIPGLYVTANLYMPKKRVGKLPAVIYVCGHSPVVRDGIPHGNKVAYQHHATWLAENGYVCLIVDTLQLGEIAGLHHGTYRYGLWWWISLGYTPAGIELWNAMRGVDYLLTREEVDPERLGVTGRSGGGATSWWLGAADERIKCIVPVAGIADLLAHVSEGYPGRLRSGVVAGHCDCMYFVNTELWDYSRIIALCAPRAVMLGNSDVDEIFPVPGYRRMTDKIKKLYDLLGQKDKFALLETKGGHTDTPELRKGAFQWFNRWLKNDTGAISDDKKTKWEPKDLKVFDRLPKDAINDVVHERFRRAANLELPASDEVIRSWWKEKAPQLEAELLQQSFRAWPSKPAAVNLRLAGEIKHDGVRLRGWDFVSEEGIDLRFWLVESEKIRQPTEVLVSVVDEAGWKRWQRDLGPEFTKVLHSGGNPGPYDSSERDEARFHQNRAFMESAKIAFAIITPRGVGRTRWSGEKPEHIQRRFYLLGRTRESCQVWDVRRAIQGLSQVSEATLTLQGEGEMGAIALYAGMFEPRIKKFELQQLPTSHRPRGALAPQEAGPTFLNVLRVLDLPQTVALAARKAEVKLYASKEQHEAWSWALRVQKATGSKNLTLRE